MSTISKSELFFHPLFLSVYVNAKRQVSRFLLQCKELVPNSCSNASLLSVFASHLVSFFGDYRIFPSSHPSTTTCSPKVGKMIHLRIPVLNRDLISLFPCSLVPAYMHDFLGDQIPSFRSL